MSASSGAPPLRSVDLAGVIGFELQFEHGQVAARSSKSPTITRRRTRDSILSTLSMMGHVSDHARTSSTVLGEFPLFSVTIEGYTTTYPTICPLARLTGLPSALTCMKLEGVSAPLPLRTAIAAADAVEAWAAGPWKVLRVSGTPSSRMYDLDLNMSLNRAYVNVPARTSTLLDALVMPQTTVAVPLVRLRRWLHAALATAKNSGFQPARGVHVSQTHAGGLGDFSAFMRRVDAACRADGMPEDYCGLLALSGCARFSILGRRLDPRMSRGAEWACRAWRQRRDTRARRSACTSHRAHVAQAQGPLSGSHTT